MQTDAMRDDAVFQDAAIARQDDAVLFERPVNDLRIIEIIAIERIKAEQAKDRGELAQMHIAYEFGFAQWPVAQPDDGRDVQTLEHRIDGDAVAILQLIVKSDGTAIDQNHLDFRVRNADRLDRVLDGRMALELERKIAPSFFLCQEKVELLIETKSGNIWNIRLQNLVFILNIRLI